MRYLRIAGVLLGLGGVGCQIGDEKQSWDAAVRGAICKFTGGQVLLYEAPVPRFQLEQTSDEPAFYALRVQRTPCRELEVLGASKKVVPIPAAGPAGPPTHPGRWVFVRHGETGQRGWALLAFKRFPEIDWTQVPIHATDALFHTANWRQDVIDAICRANRAGGEPFWKARQLPAHLFKAPGAPESAAFLVGFEVVARRPCRSLRMVATLRRDRSNAWVLVETEDRSVRGWTSLAGHGSGDPDVGADYIPTVTFDWSQAPLAPAEVLGPKGGLPDLAVRFRRIARLGDPCVGPSPGVKQEPWSVWFLNRGPGLGPMAFRYRAGGNRRTLRFVRRPFPGETISFPADTAGDFPGETRIELDPAGVITEVTKENNAVTLPPAPTVECR